MEKRGGARLLGRWRGLRVRRTSTAPEPRLADSTGEFKFLGPGHSVRDRIGQAMIEDAEMTGRLRPGGRL